jgi:hypothetical protein
MPRNIKLGKYKYLQQTVYHHRTKAVADKHAQALRRARPNIAVSVKKLKTGYSVYLSSK